jgi:threonine aldolase
MRSSQVSFRYDAPEYSPVETATSLLRLTEEYQPAFDAYSIGGAVQALEEKAATILGKERALFMPTGTMANHLAVRALMGDSKRVLVQERGHLYNDCGDCLGSLSGFTPVPLGKGSASYSLAEVEQAHAEAMAGRVRSWIGALVIETPVRRCLGQAFNYGELTAVCSWARSHGVGTHLDGARLFIASAYSGIPPAKYASHFDTVYVSLYKYFNAPAGAILAGSHVLLDDLYHDRRMFGGSLNQAWIMALPAMDAIDGFAGRFDLALKASEELKTLLRGRGLFSVDDIPNGTNIFTLTLPKNADANAFRGALAASQVILPEPEGLSFHLKVNESILGMQPADLAGLMTDAAQDSFNPVTR